MIDKVLKDFMIKGIGGMNFYLKLQNLKFQDLNDGLCLVYSFKSRTPLEPPHNEGTHNFLIHVALSICEWAIYHGVQRV